MNVDHGGREEISRKIVETLRTLPKDGPEPSYLVVEASHLRILLDSLQNVDRPNPNEATRELADIQNYLAKVIQEAESLSLEEKEMVMEQLTNYRKRLNPGRQEE